MLHRQIPNFQLHGSQFQTLADEVEEPPPETVPENSIPGLSDSVVKIREDVKSGVENLTEECVSTMADVTRLLMKVFIFLVLICVPKCTPLPATM
ncbi:hypothetical protein IC582_012915 [Cucumis melo]|uniref:Kinesin-like protein KIN12B n=2 Tax=Cucumis melo TaxID=3656 RepID=A0A5A7SWN0_CUCMM|nr:kinesin-like protein KIN12B [Cucumis melo var. makuwa]